jgi:hypothetical protein
LYKDRFDITFIDFGTNLEIIRKKFKNSAGKHVYIDQNFEQAFPKLDNKTLSNAIVICSDVVEHIRKMEHLLDALVELSKKSRLLLVSTPERERLYGYDQSGAPENKCHVREWKLEELEKLLMHWGMNFLIGLTRTNNLTRQRATNFVVSGKNIDSVEVYKSTEMAQENAVNIDKLIGEIPLAKSILKKVSDEVVAVINPVDNNFILNHLKAAINGGFGLNISIFKFIDDKSLEEFYSAAPESINRLTVAYVGHKKITGKNKEIYPISFSVVCNKYYKFKSNDRISLLQINNFKYDYLPELIFGFPENMLKSETLSSIDDPNAKSKLNTQLKHLEREVKKKNIQIKQLNSSLELARQPIAKKLVRKFNKR